MGFPWDSLGAAGATQWPGTSSGRPGARGSPLCPAGGPEAGEAQGLVETQWALGTRCPPARALRAGSAEQASAPTGREPPPGCTTHLMRVRAGWKAAVCLAGAPAGAPAERGFRLSHWRCQATSGPQQETGIGARGCGVGSPLQSTSCAPSGSPSEVSCTCASPSQVHPALQPRHSHTLSGHAEKHQGMQFT